MKKSEKKDYSGGSWGVTLLNFMFFDICCPKSELFLWHKFFLKTDFFQKIENSHACTIQIERTWYCAVKPVMMEHQ
jgi:hypothetical protein